MFRRYIGGQKNERAVAAGRAGMQPALDAADTWLADRQYFAGRTSSLVDIHWMPYLEYLQHLGEADSLARRTHLTAWWKRVSGRPAWQQVARNVPPALRRGVTAESKGQLSKILIEAANSEGHASCMPTRERVAAFIATIEKRQFLEAIPEFYAEDMTAQENNEPPRIGRDAQVANEKRALALMRFEESRVGSYLVDGDRVAILYVMDIVGPDGARVHFEEIAYQTWAGDRIQGERYFYDPAQMAPLRRPR